MDVNSLRTSNDPGLFRTDALVDGEWAGGTGRFVVNDSATGRKLADVANLTRAEAAAAIATA